MASSGPLIEELPDDFDVQAEKSKVRETASQPAPKQEDGGAMRKGFFSPKPKPSAPAKPAKASPAAEGAAQGGRQAPTPTPDAREVGSEITQEVGEVVSGLRARLLKAAGDARKSRRQGEVAECTESLRQSLAAMSSQSRWPSSQARAARERATREADAALAELRGASNDARRMRSGEEKRALAELRKAAEDGMDRVKKLSESVAPKDKTPENEARAVVAAFHSLPLTAKLRLLVDEKAAVALLLASFGLGVALMSGILLEVYVAWGCGFQCER